MRVRLREQDAGKLNSVHDVLPLSPDYNLMSDAFPLCEFGTPALMLEFFLNGARFANAEKGYNRKVQAYDVLEVNFIEPALPSNFLLVTPTERVQEFAIELGNTPQVFMFKSGKFALVSLHG